MEIKSVLTRTIFFEIWTVDYYKGSLTEIEMSLTKNSLEFLTIYIITTPHYNKNKKEGIMLLS